jgi:hypothetical protein
MNKIWLFRKMLQEELSMVDMSSTRSREAAIYQGLIWAVGKSKVSGGVYKVKMAGRNRDLHPVHSSYLHQPPPVDFQIVNYQHEVLCCCSRLVGSPERRQWTLYVNSFEQPPHCPIVPPQTSLHPHMSH